MSDQSVDEFTKDEIEAAWGQAEPMDPRGLGKGQDASNVRVVWPHGITIQRDRFHKRGKLGWTIKNGKPVPFQAMTMAQVSALLAAQRNRRYEAQREKAGFVRVTVRIPEGKANELRSLVRSWNGA